MTERTASEVAADIIGVVAGEFKGSATPTEYRYIKLLVGRIIQRHLDAVTAELRVGKDTIIRHQAKHMQAMGKCIVKQDHEIERLKSVSLVENTDALFESLRHGDEIHQGWLKEAIEAFAVGKPIPAPRDQKNTNLCKSQKAEREIERLKQQLRKKKSTYPLPYENMLDANDSAGEATIVSSEAAKPEYTEEGIPIFKLCVSRECHGRRIQLELRDGFIVCPSCLAFYGEPDEATNPVEGGE